MSFRNKQHLMYIVRDYLTDNIAEVLCSLDQEHLISIHFEFFVPESYTRAIRKIICNRSKLGQQGYGC